MLTRLLIVVTSPAQISRGMSLLVIKDPVHHDYREFISQAFNADAGAVDVYIVDSIGHAPALNRVLTTYYQQLRHLANQAGKGHDFLINVWFNQPKHFNAQNYSDVRAVEGEDIGAFDVSVKRFSNTSNSGIDHESNGPEFGSFECSAVGGTFDYLHDGHKILLSLARFLCSKRLIVGITGPKLLQNKKHAEFLQLYAERERSVVRFLQKLSWDSCPYEIYEINDVCGPTGYVRNIDALVVSGETRSGGDYVNKVRQEQGFPQLEVVVIDVIGENVDNSTWEGKISSTTIRASLALRV